MSSILRLQDGTEFDIRMAGSLAERRERPVVVGFSEGELVRLLMTQPGEAVIFCDKNMTYGEFRDRMNDFGGIAAYVPNPRDYFRIANHL